MKIACAEKAFKTVFPYTSFKFIGKNASSGVCDQPLSDQETYSGAWNRAKNLKESHPEGDFWIGIEGGIEIIHNIMHAFAWMVVLNGRNHGEARSAPFPLPEKIKLLVDQGIELGQADDLVFKRSNSKQKDGAVGILTKGIINRTYYYEHALILALIPFVNQEFYFTVKDC